MRFEVLQTQWFKAFFGGLASAGVTDVVVSPGSRSTPLVAAAVTDPRLHVQTLYDERSASFFALGQARSTRRPTVVIRTSGTAGAHDLPAVLEARHGWVPLIVVTADRPAELQGAGAPQTLDQRHLFQPHVRADFDLGLADLQGLDGVCRKAAQAVFRSMHPPGPVHVNAPARKPLEPREPGFDDERGLAERVSARVRDPVRIVGSQARFTPAALAALPTVSDPGRAWLVAGPSVGSGPAPESVSGFLEATGWSLAAETGSGLRHMGLAVYDAYDWKLESERPRTVVWLGAAPASRVLQDWWRQAEVRVAVHPYDVMDASGLSATTFIGDVDDWLGRAAVRWASDRTAQTEWMERAARLWDRARELPFSEATAVRTVLKRIPPQSHLVIGNSLPIRLVDRFAPASDRSLRVFHQRGVNGIDGLVSGAAGTASDAPGATVALLGDVSFLHDINGLEAARQVAESTGRSLVLVVLHNQGGRIFEELPLGDRGGALMNHFVTPHRKDLEGVARTFGVAFRRAADPSSLEEALDGALAEPAATLVQVDVPPDGAREAATRMRGWAQEIRGD